MQHTSRKRRLYESFLSEVPILASLQPQERAKIADVLESRIFSEGEDVIREGDAGEEFFLVESGTAVAVKRDANGHESVVKQYTKGDYFGGQLIFLMSLKVVADKRQNWHFSIARIELHQSEGRVGKSYV